jgi:hypothetical protein
MKINNPEPNDTTKRFERTSRSHDPASVSHYRRPRFWRVIRVMLILCAIGVNLAFLYAWLMPR